MGNPEFESQETRSRSFYHLATKAGDCLQVGTQRAEQPSTSAHLCEHIGTAESSKQQQDANMSWVAESTHLERDARVRHVDAA
eukprot:366238-Chlamydomonas_euryale.AAC.8